MNQKSEYEMYKQKSRYYAKKARGALLKNRYVIVAYLRNNEKDAWPVYHYYANVKRTNRHITDTNLMIHGLAPVSAKTVADPHSIFEPEDLLFTASEASLFENTRTTFPDYKLLQAGVRPADKIRPDDFKKLFVDPPKKHKPRPLVFRN